MKLSVVYRTSPRRRLFAKLRRLESSFMHERGEHVSRARDPLRALSHKALRDARSADQLISSEQFFAATTCSRRVT